MQQILNIGIEKLNSIDQKKKNTERSYIQPLFDYLKINEGSIIETESPDFIILYNGQKVGIELVTICPSSKFDSKGRSLSVLSKQKRKDALKYYEKLLAERNENILIDVQFKRVAFWNTERKHIFIKQVADEIEHLRNVYTDKFFAGEVISSGKDENIKFVESIQVVLDNTPEPHVISPSLEYLNKITQDDFNQCLRGKLEKLFRYKLLKENESVQEYWLVIAIHYNEPYEFWTVPYELPLNNGYKRIYLIQYDGIKELVTQEIGYRE